MGASTFSGPLLAGTVREGAGQNTGYVVLSQTGTITQNSTSAVSTTFTLPENAQILAIHVDVTTAFNSATSATLSVGTAAAGTQYASSVDVKTAAGRIVPTYSGTQLGNMASIGSNTSVVATVTPSGATSAGAVRVTLVYAQK